MGAVDDVEQAVVGESPSTAIMLYFVPSVPHVLPSPYKIAALGRYMRNKNNIIHMYISFLYDYIIA